MSKFLNLFEDQTQKMTEGHFLRRSARISKNPVFLGSVYSRKKAQLRPKPFRLVPNPIRFTIEDGNVRFIDSKVINKRGYVEVPKQGNLYDRVRVVIEYENHTNTCENPDNWITFSEKWDLYFTHLGHETILQQIWTEKDNTHEKNCNTMIYYSIKSIDKIVYHSENEQYDI